MKNVLLPIGIVVLFLVILVVILNFKNQTAVNLPFLSEQKITTVLDLQNFLASTSLPLKNTKVQRVTERTKDYVIEAATNGNIDNPISFEINGGKIFFTSIGNSNLGVMNNSVLKKQDGKIIYNNIYNGINLIYTPSSQGILEEYEVRAKRNIDYLIQKIDLSNLTYKKQDDGSIIFYNQKQEFAFAIPKPVMYEEFNTKNRNFDLHYEIFEYQGNTYLAKVIDPGGKEWLAKSNYPVMIDATILLTLFSYRSYPTVNNNWQIGIQTVGSGDLKILPSQGTTLSLTNDSSKDLNFLILTCGGKKIEHQALENGVLFPNFSCDLDIVVNTTVIDPGKQNNLDFIYSGVTNTVASLVDTGKPIIISSSVNPPVVKVGDTLTVSAEIADKKGITSVTADMGGVETIDLKLTSGTVRNGIWKADWKVHGTGTKTYRILISATNGTDVTQASIGFFDPYTCTGGGDHAGADWNPATDCPSGFAGDHTNIGTLSVNNGQTATVQAYNGTSFGYASTSATTSTIAGTITANAKGFAGGTGSGAGQGPGGGGGSGGNKGGGAGYGGRGHGVSGSAGTFYGSLPTPTDKGSGGGSGIGQVGGAGGGAITINTTGTLTLSGSITSNGGAGSSCGGGGSGGTVYIAAGTITGAGSITANGGAGGGSCSTGGHGAGGRVAVYYTTTNSYSGTITVSLGGSGAEYGTSLIKGSSTGDLIIPSINSKWYGSDLTSWVFHDLTINATINFVATSATLITITATGSSSFASGITITTTGSYTTNANGAGVFFNLTGDLTIPSTTSITASGLGYAGGTGSGAGAGSGGGGGASGNSGGGGGHGGRGANGAASGGSAYDSLTQPIDLGSGGGSGIGNVGGAGGGAIKIKTTGSLTVSGSIVSNGSNGSGCGAGGAGGSIYLDTQQLRGAGTITANGGNGGGSCSSPGGGGGGRIALYCSGGYNWTGTALTAANIVVKGTGGSSGANGTVYNQGCSLVNTSINGTTTIGGSVRIQ